MDKAFSFFDCAMVDSGKTAVMRIYGYIGMKLWEDEKSVFSADDVRKAIQELPAGCECIEVQLNSRGGSVFEGVEIYEALRAADQRVEVDVVGSAFSIASVILLAGDVRRISKLGQVMIHEPVSGVYGNAQLMESRANQLRKLSEQCLDLYVDRTGMDRDTLSKDLTNETFYSAEEAVSNGFCTELIESADASGVNASGKVLQLDTKAERMAAAFGWSLPGEAAAVLFERSEGRGEESGGRGQGEEGNSLSGENGKHGISDKSTTNKENEVDIQLLKSLEPIFGSSKAIELAEANPEAKSLADFSKELAGVVDEVRNELNETKIKLQDAEEAKATLETQLQEANAKLATAGKAPVVVTATGDDSVPAPKQGEDGVPVNLKGKPLAEYLWENDVNDVQATYGRKEVFMNFAEQRDYDKSELI